MEGEDGESKAALRRRENRDLLAPGSPLAPGATPAGLEGAPLSALTPRPASLFRPFHPPKMSRSECPFTPVPSSELQGHLPFTVSPRGSVASCVEDSEILPYYRNLCLQLKHAGPPNWTIPHCNDRNRLELGCFFSAEVRNDEQVVSSMCISVFLASPIADGNPNWESTVAPQFEHFQHVRLATRRTAAS